MRPDPTRRRIALFGSFGAGNLGNEATLQAMIYNLRRYLPNAEITCVCQGPENTEAEHNIPAVPIRAPFPIWKLSSGSSNNDAPAGGSNGSVSETAIKPNRSSKAFTRLRAQLRTCAFPLLEAYRWFMGIVSLKDSNLLVMTGTGMLGGYAIELEPLGLHYEMFRWAIIAKLCRCKLLFVSVGGGPIHKPLSRYFVRTALSLADYRSYRDTSSKDHLKALGVDVKNDAVYPDLAFSLPKAVMPVIDGPRPQAVVIGVGLMNYHDRFGSSGNDETIYRDYLERLSSFVVRLLERNYIVRLLIGDQVWDQDVRQDVRRELEKRGVKYQGGRIIDEPASSVNELLSQLSSVDVLVASRFHNVLLALMLGKPVVALSYHEKVQSLMNSVGLGGSCQDIEQIDVDSLMERVINLQETAASIKLKMAREAESCRVALDEQYERILKYAG